MTNKWVQLYDDGVITRGELISRLIRTIDEVRSEELSQSILEELVGSIKEFLETLPEEVFLIIGATFLNEEAHKAYIEAEKIRLNNLRPAMKRFLLHVSPGITG